MRPSWAMRTSAEVAQRINRDWAARQRDREIQRERETMMSTQFTIDINTMPLEAALQHLRRIYEDAGPTREPVLYKFADPMFPGHHFTRYRCVNGRWEVRGDANPTERWSEPCQKSTQLAVDQGILVPVEPMGTTPDPTPTFAVGDWVQCVNRINAAKVWAKARQVNGFTASEWSGRISVQMVDGSEWYASDLRRATPDEIMSANRIEPVVGMLWQSKTNGRVYLLTRVSGDVANGQQISVKPNESGGISTGRDAWTTDHYTVLDEYTVVGARR